MRVALAHPLPGDDEPNESSGAYAGSQWLALEMMTRLVSAFADPITSPDDQEAALSEASYTDSDAVVIEDRLRLLVHEARDQQFEDGMDSAFASGIRSMVMSYGATAVAVIAKHWRIMAQLYPKEFSEIVVQLGRMDHEPTRTARRNLIENALQHPDPGLRDAAALGLDALADPASERVLLKASRSESVPAIKEMLNSMLQDLAHPS